jgi:hypothetical protein
MLPNSILVELCNYCRRKIVATGIEALGNDPRQHGLTGQQISKPYTGRQYLG